LFERLAAGITEFIVLSIVFGSAAFLLHGWKSLVPDERQKRNWRVNGSYFAFDLMVTAPLLLIVSVEIRTAIEEGGRSTGASLFDSMPSWAVAIAAVMVSDFIGYWRHRLMHLAPLWPVHAAHHSDEDLTWFTLVRFHPINRLISVCLDAVILSALGMPVWAVIFSNRVRHYYGYMIHSDLNWRFGPLKYLFVSPFLHRWHHATDEAARDTNFATVFSIYDVMFGTFYCPKHRAKDLGVNGPDYPTSFIGQLWYPFDHWGRLVFAPLIRGRRREHL
jgi:sterol desaturase/sphingolipid hydroxylase (fatty acid hydroxylase superfamily)